MKSLAKLTFGALVLTGAALTTVQPANAATSFSFSYGYGGPHVSLHFNPCYRPYYGRALLQLSALSRAGFLRRRLASWSVPLS